MILVINAGSSSVKFAVFDPSNLNEIYKTQVNSIEHAFDWLKANEKTYQITCVGHRIVHGGTKFFEPIVLNKNILIELKKLIPLAPLHQPQNIAAVEFLINEYPHIKQIGCFDTAFHRTQQPLAKLFAIPDALTAEGVIRYGFHGLSYEYISTVLTDKIGAVADTKVIVAHLGSGASMCAMENKQSVATSMGFSALDGLMMSTRCGNIDPGVLLYLLQEKNYSAQQISDLLYDKSGLLGVSGIASDMQTLLADNSKSAQTAVDLFCYRAAGTFGTLLADLQGCSALIFTAGIGEHASEIRDKICSRLQWLGVKINNTANSKNDIIISTNDSKIVVAVIPTNEEFIIAKHSQALV